MACFTSCWRKCPKVLKVLQCLLHETWKKMLIHSSWCTTEGIYIPKEADSVALKQFRPISLLNMEGKVLFGVLIWRMTRFTMQNISMQKAGIPGFSGCLEHASMTWSVMQEAGTNKELHVIWLDLANAYGLVAHRRNQKAKDFFILEHVQTFIKQYCGQFKMHLTTKEYTSTWHPLEVGIPMGCTISPLLFVLAMEMIVRGAECSSKGLDTSENMVLPMMRAFMHDITSLTRGAEEQARLLQQLEELTAWATWHSNWRKAEALHFSKKESYSYSSQLLESRCSLWQISLIKNLGRWYAIPPDWLS